MFEASWALALPGREGKAGSGLWIPALSGLSKQHSPENMEGVEVMFKSSSHFSVPIHRVVCHLETTISSGRFKHLQLRPLATQILLYQCQLHCDVSGHGGDQM